MSVRRAVLATTLAGVTLTLAPSWTRHAPHYLWNASASVPIGFYRIETAGRIEVADLAVVLPPEPLAAFMAERGYLPHGVPLLKRVLALAGTKVCRIGAEILVHNIVHGMARERDSQGRTLPDWQGCRVVANDEIFVLNRDVPDSLDGRYFGPLPLASVVGRAVPIWTFNVAAASTEFHRTWAPLALAPATALPSAKPNRSTTMAQIGTFTRNDNGFFGDIRTLTLHTRLTILPADKSSTENAPDHRVLCEGAEIGAAWERTGEKAGSYLSVVIDDPSFTQPIRANLFRSDAGKDAWTLHWSRPSKHGERH